VNFLWRLAPFLRKRVGQKPLTAEDTPLQAVRHIPAGGAFGISAAPIILSPANVYRLGLAVFLIIGGGLVFTPVTLKLLLADQAIVPMAIAYAISKINHFLR
jgi:hypothetical protein